MAKPAWKKFPYADKAFVLAGAALKKNWERLHRGDREAFPDDAAVQEAWCFYHQGEFHKACEAGLAAGVDGYNAANKATMIYANYLEQDDKRKLDLFQAVAARCEELQQAQPKNANAYDADLLPLQGEGRASDVCDWEAGMGMGDFAGQFRPIPHLTLMAPMSRPAS